MVEAATAVQTLSAVDHETVGPAVVRRPNLGHQRPPQSELTPGVRLAPEESQISDRRNGAGIVPNVEIGAPRSAAPEWSRPRCTRWLRWPSLRLAL